MELLVDRKDRVLHLTLNRPDKRNALNANLCAAIVKAIRSAQKQHEVGAILIEAAGRAFCAGMDLDEAVATRDDELADLHDDLFTIGAASTKPIVLCVNGAALGGGLGLVAQGHVVVASQTAIFGLTEVRIGLWPLLVYRAVEASLGARRTLELSLTGRTFSAEEALAWGLVHHISAPTQTSERANALATGLARTSPAAIACGMQYFRSSRGQSWSEAGELAKSLRRELIDSEDFREGYRAFKEKREARWPSMPQDFYREQE